MTPHLYVLYTRSGNEDEIVRLMNLTVLRESPPSRNIEATRIPASAEYFFIPKTEFTKKFHGVDTLIQQNLYPGYVFFTTPSPVDFYQRAKKAHFRFNFGKYFIVLRNSKEKEIPVERIYREDYATEEAFKAAQIEQDEKKFMDFIARITDEEEESILSLCGLKREAASGDIVPLMENAMEFSMDVASLLNSASDSTSDSTSLAEMFKTSVDVAGVPDARSVDGADDPFTISMSKAVKFVRKGTVSPDRHDGDVKYIVLSGPLRGRERNIIYVDAHKKSGLILTPFMGREVRVKVPISIVKTVELDDMEMVDKALGE